MKTRFVLIETSHAGNVGAAARAIKTMGFDELVLQWVPRHRNTEADALARMAHSAAALQH